MTVFKYEKKQCKGVEAKKPKNEGKVIFFARQLAACRRSMEGQE